MQNKYLGIDAGATKTHAVLYDDAGNVLYETTQGQGNIIVNETEAIQNVTTAIEHCLKQVTDTDDVKVLLGMAGIDISDKSKELTAFLESTFPRFSQVEIMNDGYLGMVAALKGRDGIFVISGTGSVVYGKKHDYLGRVGGYGHLLGDEGSAYWIGHELFKGLTTFIDDDQLDSPLYQALLVSEGVSEKEAYHLIKKFYTLSKEEVAQYAVWVSQHAENGDQEAIEILHNAGASLARQIKRLMRRLNFTPKPLFAFSGSVLVKNAIVLETLLQQLPDVRLLKEKIEPTKAVYYYWKKENEQCLRLA